MKMSKVSCAAVLAFGFLLYAISIDVSWAGTKTAYCLRMMGGGFVPNPICYATKAACLSVRRSLVTYWKKRGTPVSGTCTLEKM
jgi:hypothetical protein